MRIGHTRALTRKGTKHIQSIERKDGDNLDSSGTPSKKIIRANNKSSGDKRHLLKSKNILRASPQ